MDSPTDTTGEGPRLSVVVPVYNDPGGIRLTLESLTGQTLPRAEFEILPVDNGSSDTTPDVIETYAERYPDLVVPLSEDDLQGSYAARNEGIRHARGDLVSFIDADITVEADWAESVIDSYETHGWDYMGCDVAVYIDGAGTLGARYDRLLGGFPIEEYLAERHFTVTACLTVRRELFAEVGLFDDRIRSQGDHEFGERVYEAGFDQQYEPSITIYHPARATTKAWLKKQFRIGGGAVQLRRYHPAHAESTHPLDPRKFLPPRPRYFYARLTDATDPAADEAVALYAIDYLSKLARAVGGIHEHYFTEPRETADDHRDHP